MFVDRLRYELQLMGRRVILTPVLVMLGFALLAVLLEYLKVAPARFLSGGLEMIVPIATGAVVGTIIMHDPALELQLTMPKRYTRTSLLRLVLIAGWAVSIALLSTAIISVLNQVYMFQPQHAWAEPVQFLAQVLAWFATLLWCVGLGFCFSLLFRSRSAAGALLGGIWIAEILFKDYIFLSDWLRPFSLFPTTLVYPATVVQQQYVNMWFTNRFEVLGMGVALILIGWLLLHNTEALLKGTSEE
jgi:hypothetical protein